ncbi:MAG: hypothetical protein H0X43_02465 [Nitrosospira sp.]|nr:hypothetical protein [Nitrosospira sp.]
MEDPDDWFIYETELFVEEVSQYLGDFELSALRRQLVHEPFAGKLITGASPLSRVDYAGATIIYSVNLARHTITLIQIGKATSSAVEIDESVKPKLKEITGLLRKGGYFAAGKEAFEWLIGVVKDWL